jgi:protein TonB
MNNLIPIFFLILFLNSKSFSQELHFEGLYIALKDSSSLVKTNKYLKFYEEGDVVSVSSPGTPQKVKNWLKLEKEGISKGKYKLRKGKIYFLSKNKYGTVKYSGKMLTDGTLLLDIKSMINGNKSQYQYKYLSSIELQKEEKSMNKSPVKIFLYEDVQIKPQFIGGKEEMFKYIGRELIYPKKSQEAKTEGLIYVRFIIEKNGSCSNPEILRGLDEACNKAVINLIENMPKWEPAKNNKKEIRCYYVLPIKFEKPK